MIGSDSRNFPPQVRSSMELVGLLQVLSDPAALAKHKTEIEALTKDATSAYEALAKRQKEIAAAQATLDSKTNERDAALAGIEASKTNLANERAAWETARVQQQSGFDDQKASHASAQQQLDAARADIAVQRAEVAKLTAEQKTLKASLDKQASDLAERTAALEAREDNLAQVQERLNQRAAKFAAAAAE